MTTRGMLFSGPLVRAIIDGRKTVTRRPITKAASLKIEFWSSKLCGDGDDMGGFGGFGDLDWGAHRIKAGGGCSPPGHNPRCDGRDYCAIWVDGDAHGPCGLGVGQYLHVPGHGGETSHRVHARIHPGDIIYVRETTAVLWNDADHCGCLSDPADPTSVRDYCPEHMTIEYRADTGAVAPGGWDTFPVGERMVTWTPSIHMPKTLARIHRRVIAVHAEQIQEITHDGAMAEGIEPDEPGGDARVPFARVWDKIYGGQVGDQGPLGWADNPWVWAYEFEVVPR